MKKLGILIFLSIPLAAPVPAQTKPLERIFLFGAVQYFIVPDLSGLIPELPGGSLIDPLPGFRAGLGYEWKHLRLSLEGGWTKVKGDNPLVLEAELVPFMLQAGWDFTPFEKAGIRFGPVLGAGIARVQAEHYTSALDMFLDKRSRSQGAALLVHPGLEISWTFLKAFSVYAEAGAVVALEKDGPLPLPEIRAGLRLRPFALKRKPRAGAVEGAKADETAKTEPESFRAVYTVYFAADSAVPLDSSALDQAGRLLAERPELGAGLKGYASPLPSAKGHLALSENRTLRCAEYLSAVWGIVPERIYAEWFGADAAPEGTDGTHGSLRAVEIIIK